MVTGLATRFGDLVGGPPAGVWQAPARVNLIGEHTDYCGGFAVTFAIDRRTSVAARLRSDGRYRWWSTSVPTPPTIVEGTNGPPGSVRGWARYPMGVLWALRRAGVEVPGLDVVVDSDVPIGSGLSSSAALEAAVAVAVNDLAGAGFDHRQLAGVCHQAETDFVGAPTGLLDQLTVLLAPAGHALLIDFRSLEVEAVPLTISPLVVVDTGVRHRNTDGAYADRRRACEAAAAALGVPQLRDASSELVSRGLDGVLARRARHVVTENTRVLEAAQRLRSGADVGPLLYASHESLRRDFEVSCPELDEVVRVARSLGAAGARMTGAGFGGSCISLGVDEATLGPAVTAAFAAAGFGASPTTFAVAPEGGAGRTR